MKYRGNGLDVNKNLIDLGFSELWFGVEAKSPARGIKHRVCPSFFLVALK